MTGTATDRATLAARAQTLLGAHHAPAPLVLANVWDVASARAVEQAGFTAVATSSHAVAGALGEGDDDSADAETIFLFLARIARSVRLPVTADLEAGHRLGPDELVARMLGAGIVGCNLEDTDHHGPDVLVEAERQAAFLAAVRAAADRAGVHVVINARIDTFIRHAGHERAQLDEAIRRGRRYFEAGVDCVYPITLSEPSGIRSMVEAMPGPVNVLARPNGLSIEELGRLGVRRISFGAGLHALAMEAFRSALAGIAGRGSA